MEVNNVYFDPIYPDITLAGCVDIFENVWPDYEDTIERIEKESQDVNSFFKWSKASTSGKGVLQNERTNLDISLTNMAKYYDNSLSKELNNRFYYLLVSSLFEYSRKNNLGDLEHENYNLLKYSSNQEYVPHRDTGPGLNRTVSAICYLNSNYQGGHLEFINFGIKIKPEPGMLILFPSNYAYLHKAHPVTKGSKYAIVTWLNEI